VGVIRPYPNYPFWVATAHPPAAYAAYKVWLKCRKRAVVETTTGSTHDSSKEVGFMSNGRTFDTPCVYQIRVMGNLDARWSAYFADFTVSPQGNGETLLTGQIRDQAALYGLLATMGSIGLPLLSITREDHEA
jgi:hypothetical protein